MARASKPVRKPAKKTEKSVKSPPALGKLEQEKKAEAERKERIRQAAPPP